MNFPVDERVRSPVTERRAAGWMPGLLSYKHHTEWRLL